MYIYIYIYTFPFFFFLDESPSIALFDNKSLIDMSFIVRLLLSNNFRSIDLYFRVNLKSRMSCEREGAKKKKKKARAKKGKQQFARR